MKKILLMKTNNNNAEAMQKITFYIIVIANVSIVLSDNF